MIGAVAAWRARRAGLSVTSLDPQAGSGASYAAAGMLAAVTEADFGERELLELNLASAARWPAFADEVGAAAGTGIGFRRCGVLSVAYDAADAVRIAGLKSSEIAQRLGYEGRAAMIHRDDLVIKDGAHLSR